MLASERIEAEADAGMDLFDVIQFLWRYKVLICACAIACGVIATILALVATPLYRAEVIVTEPRENGMGGNSSLMNQIGGLASLAGVAVGGAGMNREAQAVLSSRRLAEVFIERNNLLPELFAASKEQPSVWKGVEKMRNGVLSIREDQRKGLTTVSIRWRDPAKAAAWANDFVSLANELMRSRAIEDSTRNIVYLRDQVEKTSVVGIQRVLYNLIETETKTLMLANGRLEYAFMVVDPAVAPEGRVSPKRTIMVAGGLLLGGVIGILAAVIRDMVVRRRARAALP